MLTILLIPMKKCSNLVFFAVVSAIVLLGTACNDDAATAEQLLGRWNVQAAERDHKPTETLMGMYFDFTSAEQLVTNITGQDTDYTYQVDGGKILQRGGPIEADYSIETITDTELVLTTVIRGKHFKMVFARALPE